MAPHTLVAHADAGPPPRPAPQVLSARLLTGGALAGPVFVMCFLVDGLTEAGYDPMRHPVSSLALGTHGWVQVLNFLLAGTLYTAMGAALVAAHRRTPDVGPRAVGVLVSLVGVGLIGAGIFRTDPVSGFPPGTPGTLTSYTTSGALHDGLSVLTFLGIPLAALTCAVSAARRRRRGRAVASAVLAAAFVAGFVLAGTAFDQSPGLVAYGGLLQRVTVSLGLGWLTLLALRARGLIRAAGAGTVGAAR